MAEGGYDPGVQDGYASRIQSSRFGQQGQVCRFYLQGRCSRGQSCHYLHDSSKKNVCKYYQLGCCMYGSKCRYDHVKSDQPQKPSANNNQPPKNHTHQESNHRASRMVTLRKDGFGNPDLHRDRDAYERRWVQASEFVPGQKYQGSFPGSYAQAVGSEVASNHEQEAPVNSFCEPVREDTLLCPFYEQDGNCPYEDSCPYAHGLICDLCGLPKLHPLNEEQREQHTKECIEEHEKEMNLAFAVQASEDKDCGICLENILKKENVDGAKVDKRFGIMEKCNHIFCLSCIRMWRQGKSPDFHTAKQCPMCRTQSDFVIPSQYWISSPEEKQQLISDYKLAMGAKNCQYFKEGKGICPFDSKCYYRHALPDGSVVQQNIIKPRRRVNADGEISSEDDHLLWDFISTREEGGGLIHLEDELSLLLLGIYEDSDNEDSNNNSYGLRYNFENGEFVFTDSDTSDSDLN